MAEHDAAGPERLYLAHHELRRGALERLTVDVRTTGHRQQGDVGLQFTEDRRPPAGAGAPQKRTLRCVHQVHQLAAVAVRHRTDRLGEVPVGLWRHDRLVSHQGEQILLAARPLLVRQVQVPQAADAGVGV